MVASDVMSYSKEIRNTILENHDLSIRELQTESNCEVLSTDKESTIRFACEWDNNQAARILLFFINNTSNLIKWELQRTTTAITAFPSNGQITSYGKDKCILSWIRPDYIETWKQIESAKLLLSLHLIADNNDIIGSTDIKLLAQVDAKEFCKPENPPIHNLIFSSEESILNDSQSELLLQTALEVTKIIPQNDNNNELQLRDKLSSRPSSDNNNALQHRDELSSRPSVINFALDSFHDDVAYAQLKLINNSKRLIVWKLKTNNKCITALPRGSGLVPALKSNKCILFWQFPKNRQICHTVRSAKFLMSFRIYSETGKLLGADIAKYIGKINNISMNLIQSNMDHICVADNAPIHQIILVSDNMYHGKIQPMLRTFVSTEKIIHPRISSTTVATIKNDIPTKLKTKFTNNETVWQIGVICCTTIMLYLILQAIFKNDFSF